MEECALAAAAGSENEYEVATPHCQRNVAEHRGRFAVIRVGHPREIDQDLGIAAPLKGLEVRVRAVHDVPLSESGRTDVKGARERAPVCRDRFRIHGLRPAWAGWPGGPPPLPWQSPCRAGRPL